MGLFNFFGESEHKVFDYKPIYDEKDKDEPYVPGSYIKGSMRGGKYQKTKSHTNGISTIIGIVGLILIFVILYFIAKFYSLL